ncbi:MAG: hypothetical protein HOK97_05670 [Deltaproteobacteria bacterium]|nr:hypothetical protein [Deltaproteobacteria bacterium]
MTILDSKPRDFRDISFILMISIVLGLPLALAGSFPIINVVACGITLTALALYCFSTKKKQLSFTLITWLMAWAILITGLQLIPLPMPLLESISKPASDFQFGLDVTQASLSLDRPGTAHELIKMILYFSGALLAGNILRSNRRRRQVLWLIAFSGLAVVALGVIHFLLNWVITFNHYGNSDKFFPSSFINANHMAGYLGLAAFCALGLVFSKDRLSRFLSGFIFIACSAGVVFSLSRGGTLLFAIFLIVGLPFIIWVQKRSARSTRPEIILWIIGFVAAGLLLLAWLVPERVGLELLSTLDADTHKKFAIWPVATKIIDDCLILGCGKGAFLSYYPFYSELPTDRTYTHFENGILQLVADWGLIGALPVILGFTYSWFSTAKKFIEKPEFLAALFGVLFLFIHNLIDFSLEMSAVALTVVVLLSALESSDKRRPSQHKSKKISMPKSAGLAITLAGIIALAAATSTAVNQEIRKHVTQFSNDIINLKNANEVETLAKEICRIHPADYFAAYITTHRLFQMEGPTTRTRKWLNRALYLGPRFAPTHIDAARILIKLGAPAQAITEYRLALKYSPYRANNIAEDIYKKTGAVTAIATLNPPDAKSGHELIQYLINARAPALARQLSESAVFNTKTPSYRYLLQRSQISVLENNGTEAIRYAQDAIALMPHQYKGYLQLASVFETLGRWEELFTTLKNGMEQVTNNEELEYRFTSRLVNRGLFKKALLHANNLTKGSSKSARRGGFMRATIFEKTGRRADALIEYESLRTRFPHNVAMRQAIIRLRLDLKDINGAKKEFTNAQESGIPEKGMTLLKQLLDTYQPAQ